jgi:two-component system invasion response regulator UvrY
MLAAGKTISQIAELLSLALTTVSTHRSHILEKLGLTTNADMTRYAITHHIISDLRT